MRQDPRYLIIGNGRVARHFCHYFSSLHLSFKQWDRRQPQNALTSLAAEATHILLLIRDDAIEAFARDALTGAKARLVHFSGSLVTPLAFGAHPLMTFGQELYSPGKYRDIPFVLDADAPDFSNLLPGLPNPHQRLDPALKAKYHALCVMAGNFSCILWQKLFGALGDEFGMKPEIADMYLRQQTDNLITDYKTALTGPLARGDTATINRNIAALSGDPFQAVYKSFVDAYTLAEGKKP